VARRSRLPLKKRGTKVNDTTGILPVVIFDRLEACRTMRARGMGGLMKRSLSDSVGAGNGNSGVTPGTRMTGLDEPGVKSGPQMTGLDEPGVKSGPQMTGLDEPGVKSGPQMTGLDEPGVKSGPQAAGPGKPGFEPWSGCPPWRLVRRKLSELRLPDDRPRSDAGDVEALARSVEEHGLLVPILIEPDGTVRGGARRLAALRKLGRDAADCLVLPPGSDPAIAQLVENLQRKDLSPIEEARGFKALLERTGWSQAHLARELGIAPSRVSLALNLLDAPEEVREAVEAGQESAYAVKTAFSLRGRADGRAERVERRVREGALRRAHFGQASARVSARELPEGVRARAYADRVEITFVVGDPSPGLEAVRDIVGTVASLLAGREEETLDALRRAKARLVGSKTDMAGSEPRQPDELPPRKGKGRHMLAAGAA
jgi:ParB/RepB/Spo0J family partition protein